MHGLTHKFLIVVMYICGTMWRSIHMYCSYSSVLTKLRIWFSGGQKKSLIASLVTTCTCTCVQFAYVPWQVTIILHSWCYDSTAIYSILLGVKSQHFLAKRLVVKVPAVVVTTCYLIFVGNKYICMYTQVSASIEVQYLVYYYTCIPSSQTLIIPCHLHTFISIQLYQSKSSSCGYTLQLSQF